MFGAKNLTPGVTSAEISNFLQESYPDLVIVNRGNERRIDVLVKKGITRLNIIGSSKNGAYTVTLDISLILFIFTFGLASILKWKEKSFQSEINKKIFEAFGVNKGG